MYRKILLAIDGSSDNAPVIRQASELAQLCGAELHLLGIVETAGVIALLQVDAPYEYSRLGREQIEASLSLAAGHLSAQGLNVKTQVREGEPAHEIAAHARHITADLVILGHTDQGALARWFLGSTGADLLRKLPCSLLVATETE